jgi:hypothetical protein
MIDDCAVFKRMFGGSAEYAASGVTAECWADIEEGARLGRAGSSFDAEFAPGLGRYAEGRVMRAELSVAGIEEPASGDTLTQGGVAWRVEQVLPEGGMWLLKLVADRRGGR